MTRAPEGRTNSRVSYSPLFIYQFVFDKSFVQCRRSLSALYLFGAVFLLVWSLRFILASDLEKILTAPVRTPPGLDRWVDLYASADPVPNGRTKTNDDADARSSPSRSGSGVSVRRPHRLLGQSGRIRAAGREGVRRDGAQPVGGRASKQVGLRGQTRGLAGRLPADRTVERRFDLVSPGRFPLEPDQASVPVPFDLPGWVPGSPVRQALLVTLIALAMWATSSVLRWLWNWWVWAEQEVVLDHEQPGRKSDKWYRRRGHLLHGSGRP